MNLNTISLPWYALPTNYKLFFSNPAMYWQLARTYSLNMMVSTSLFFGSKCDEFGGFCPRKSFVTL
jgi:hypothetical protein